LIKFRIIRNTGKVPDCFCQNSFFHRRCFDANDLLFFRP